MTLDPYPNGPQHRTAAQRGNPSPASLTTPDRNKPEPAKTAGHQPENPSSQPQKTGYSSTSQQPKNKNQFRQLDGDSKQPKPDRPKMADKKPTDNCTAKVNRTTCQKP
jgi:hypothetical protein